MTVTTFPNELDENLLEALGKRFHADNHSGRRYSACA